MKKLAKRMNERINQLPRDVYKTWLYTLTFIISMQMDALYCWYLNDFYGTSDYFFTHMRGGIAISISLIFGIVDIYITKKIMYYAGKIYFHIQIVFFTDGIFPDIRIEGKTGILKYLAYYCWIISIISIVYDAYEILFVHLLKIGP